MTELGTITMRLSRVRTRELRKPISITSPHVSRSWISIRSPMRKGRSSIITNPLMVSANVAWAASAIASDPIPSVATSPLTFTSKWLRNMIRVTMVKTIRITRRPNGTS